MRDLACSEHELEHARTSFSCKMAVTTDDEIGFVSRILDPRISLGPYPLRICWNVFRIS